ncbi:MAG: aminopeptidase [Bacteroidetes bacterium]|nr:aminopeptidase [Bacteroidota bacterium]
MQLLKALTEIHAPSGEEHYLKDFILEFVAENAKNWKVEPIIIKDGIQDNLMLVFGKPRTAVFAHMDSIGYTVAYNNKVVKIGGPDCTGNWELVGHDSKGEIDTILLEKNDELFVKFKRPIDRGTSLTFKPNFQETKNFIQSPYMDNRLGVYNALKLCETLENGIVAFSCWEEHKGGAVPYLGKMIYEEYSVSQALISDITWVTEGVLAGKGVAISMRDSSIPRRSFVNHIIELTKQSGIPYQLEVESAGGSDGTALQMSPYPFDWCFIGAPESHVHSPLEKVHKADIDAMLKLYEYLMEKL